ncbi:MAG: AhpC/TSA family protein [Gammaproteobacteria bacterium]|nr:AhpC/TSA family protein [Gammaproteobacteria bacterium]
MVQVDSLYFKACLSELERNVNVLKPRQAVPSLEISTLKGPWSLVSQQPENFTMLVFYRGLHCPICSKYIQELDRMTGDFAEAGVTALALSSDDSARAQQASDDWGLSTLNIAYDVSADQARAWGLHRSAGRGKTSIGIEEPPEFSEPGLFLIRPDETLYWSQVSTMPFARPHFKEILGALKFALEKDYPARGELD